MGRTVYTDTDVQNKRDGGFEHARNHWFKDGKTTRLAAEESPRKPEREDRQDPLEKPVKTLVDSLGGVTSTLAGILATKVTEQPKAQWVRREVKRDKQGFIAEILEVPEEDGDQDEETE
jgi:hypothetical protein